MADRNIYVGGTNGKASQPTKIYVGNTSDKARLVTKVYVGNSSNKAVQVWPKLKWAEIYQKCEYIYNTNRTEYINLGFKPDSNTRVVIRFQFQSEGESSYERYVIGAGFRDWGIGFFYWNYGNNHYKYIFCDFNRDYYTGDNRLQYDFGSASSMFSPYTYQVDFNKDGGKFIIAENTSMGESKATFSQSDISYPIGLFTSRGDGVNDAAKAYVYYCRIYQNNSLIRNLIPCYRKSDYKPGMYDFVNDVFYTNNGTGEFYKGPDVN